jgi:hypothetical protein
MTLTLLDLHCLNALCDDYENIPSIREDVRRSAHGDVTEEEIRDCLVELKINGWAAAFKFNVSQSQYVEVDDLNGDWPNMWFHITNEGRQELDRNWVDA